MRDPLRTNGRGVFALSSRFHDGDREADTCSVGQRRAAGLFSETLQAMGRNASDGIPAAEVAKVVVRQLHEVQRARLRRPARSERTLHRAARGPIGPRLMCLSQRKRRSSGGRSKRSWRPST
jgi:hypothetical protein